MWGAACRRAVLLVCVLLGFTCSLPGEAPLELTSRQAPAQDPVHPSSIPSQQNDLSLNWNDYDRRVWANAKTYVDAALPEIIVAVPDLNGVIEDQRAEDLNSLLEKVGKSCMELMQHTPSVASREDQITTQKTVSQVSQGAFVRAALPPIREKQTFGYLLLSKATDVGLELREYRTDKKGRPVTYSGSKSGQVSEGFVSEWLRLFPGNQNQSRFRLLGRQDLDGRKVFVIAFAEIPDRVKSPTIFSFDGTGLKLLFQGIAWVDASDFRILRMREDLLAPRPDLRLKEMTIKLRFGDVSIARAGSTLWLPLEADVAWEYKGVSVEQQHLYSDFRLYAVHSRIVPQ